MNSPRRFKVVRMRAPQPERKIAVLAGQRVSAVHRVHVASLIRAQRRLSLGIAAVALIMLLGLPLLLEVVPGLRSLHFAGVSLVWVVLGVLLYPVMWAVGHFYVRHAQRIEAEYAQVVAESDG